MLDSKFGVEASKMPPKEMNLEAIKKMVEELLKRNSKRPDSPRERTKLVMMNQKKRMRSRRPSLIIWHLIKRCSWMP